MIRTIRIALARRALDKASAELVAYDTQPAGGMWLMPISYALRLRQERQAARLATLIARA